MLLIALPFAAAEGTEDALLRHVGFDRIERLFEELNVPGAKRALGLALSGELSIDAELPRKLLDRLARAVRSGFRADLVALGVPALALILFRLTVGRDDGALTLLCRLACAAGLAERCAGLMLEAREAMAGAAHATATASPVLAAALALCGAEGRAALMTPLSALCAGALEGVLEGVCLPACALMALAAVAGHLTDHFRFDKLMALLRRGVAWLVGLTLAGLTGVLTVEGRLSATRDLGAARVVGQALRSLMPVVGGALTDSGGALLDSAAAVRNTVGLAGLLLAVGACARPVMDLAAHAFSLRLAASLLEPVADPGVAGMAADFGRVAELLAALCAGAYLILALLAGTCLGGAPGFG